VDTLIQLIPIALFAGVIGWRFHHRRTHAGAEPPNWKGVVFTVVGAWAVICLALLAAEVLL
jgi:hypothetical protein